MKTFARISRGTVAELVTTAEDIMMLYHPSLQWVDVTGQQVAVGMLQSASGFTPPLPPAATIAPATLAQLQAQLQALTAQLATLGSVAAQSGASTPSPVAAH
jgi:hypothetical protein